jgi:hypothetical protein
VVEHFRVFGHVVFFSLSVTQHSEARLEVGTMTGAVMERFATGTVVQVFLLARKRTHGRLERQWTRQSVGSPCGA